MSVAGPTLVSSACCVNDPRAMRADVQHAGIHFDNKCMTLIACQDCGRSVSDAAIACPNCGRPIAGAGAAPVFQPARAKPSAPTKVPAWVVVVAGVIVIGLVGLATRGPDKSASTLSRVAPPPGNGHAIADSMYIAVKPRISEIIFTPDPDSRRRYLMDRLNDQSDRHPRWSFGQPTFRRVPNGPMTSMTLSFQDGTELVFFDSPNPGPGNGLRLDSVSIRR